MKYSLFILLPNLSDEEIKPAQKLVEDLIAKVGGKIEKVEEFGKRKLSYPVQKVRHGFYVNYLLELDKEKIDELKNELKISSQILRFEIGVFNPKAKKVVKRDIKKMEAAAEKNEEKNKTLRQAQGDSSGKESKEKISMEDLNKKLDNILESESI